MSIWLPSTEQVLVIHDRLIRLTGAPQACAISA